MVRVDSARVSAYQPATGQRRDLFTIAATALPKGTPPPAPRLRAAPLGLVVHAGGTLDSLLVRVPDGVNLVVESRSGDVNVTDISGNARVVAQRGNVDLKLFGYAQAAVGRGNLSVMMGATRVARYASFFDAARRRRGLDPRQYRFRRASAHWRRRALYRLWAARSVKRKRGNDRRRCRRPRGATHRRRHIRGSGAAPAATAAAVSRRATSPAP